MGTWGEILKEVQASARARHPEGPDFDGIRLKYIRALRELTGRAVIVYASAWLSGAAGGQLGYSVDGADVHALMEVCHGVEEKDLDLIVHSPGGSAEAAEQMVNYLRSQFDHIRAFVPLQAKSAATMICLGCDEIVMGLHSELGPIDPQILVPVPEGVRYAPAHAVLRDFDRAKGEIAADIGALPAWTPILRGYAGGLLDFCEQQIELSMDVVAGWLEKHMLASDTAGVAPESRASRAREIAEYFGSQDSYGRFKTHGRPIRVEELEGIEGLCVSRLEGDEPLQDAVLSIYHALDLTFGGPAVKIVENHRGKRHVRIANQVMLPLALGPQGPQAPKQPAPKKRRR
jgi:hypothetical protein